MKFSSRIILGLLAAGATTLIDVLPTEAGVGRNSPADQPLSAKDAAPRQCGRRDTYNDVHYADCGPASPFAAAPERSLLDTIGHAVHQALKLQ